MPCLNVATHCSSSQTHSNDESVPSLATSPGYVSLGPDQHLRPVHCSHPQVINVQTTKVRTVKESKLETTRALFCHSKREREELGEVEQKTGLLVDSNRVRFEEKTG